MRATSTRTATRVRRAAAVKLVVRVRTRIRQVVDRPHVQGHVFVVLVSGRQDQLALNRVQRTRAPGAVRGKTRLARLCLPRQIRQGYRPGLLPRRLRDIALGRLVEFATSRVLLRHDVVGRDVGARPRMARRARRLLLNTIDEGAHLVRTHVCTCCQRYDEELSRLSLRMHVVIDHTSIGPRLPEGGVRQSSAWLFQVRKCVKMYHIAHNSLLL